jgi:abortive infection bacteriophage resistance protein
VIYLYDFDDELRIFTMEIIEKIETSLKANINDYMSEKY